MSIFDRFLNLFTPLVCLGCSTEGSLLCSSCLARLPAPSSACFRCQQRSVDGQTCAECLVYTPLQRVSARADYSGVAKQLAWQLKAHGAQAAAIVMAQGMQHLLSSGRLLIVPVPTATSRVRSRGYDQARLIAQALARQTTLPWADCLARHGQAHQVGASRTQRLQQLQYAFRIRKPHLVDGADIVLIDDVTTTGASFAAAAEVMTAAGAQSVIGLAFAQTPRQTKKPE